MPREMLAQIEKRGEAAVRQYAEQLSVGSFAARHDDIALVAHGPDVARMLGIGLDLLAQPQHAQIDAAIERVPIALLAYPQDALAREGAVRVSGERLQQVELERRHRDFLSLLVGQPVRGEVEHALPDAHALGAELGARRMRRAP